MRITGSLKIFAISLFSLFTVGTANAQFSISRVTPENTAAQRRDSLAAVSGINNDFFNEARYKAERRAIRKERNTFQLNTELTLNQTGFDNWAKGGQNTFSGLVLFSLKHAYKKNKFNADYSLYANYGMSVIDGQGYKNKDEFRIHMGIGWDITKNWSYGATVDFRSQFAKGYKSRTDNTLVSDFMAPGYLDVGGGLKYKHLKEDLTINISPIAGSMILMANKELSDKGTAGVPKGDKMVSTLGSSLRVDYKKGFAKNKFTYTTYLYIFSNYRDRTYVTWDNKLSYNLAKLFTISAFCSSYYDRHAETPTGRALQFNYQFGFGLKYEFKNK